MSDTGVAIYDMALNEEIGLSREQRVLRVPGGWIYITDTESGGGWSSTSCFIPFNNEFQPKS